MKKRIYNAREKIKKKPFYTIFTDCIAKLSKDRVSDYAASASYFIILSIIPFLMALLSIIRFLPFDKDYLFDYIKPIIPTSLHGLSQQILTGIYNSHATITIVTAITLIWAAGKGFFAILKGLHQIYEIEKFSNWLILRILASLFAILFVIIVAASLCIMVFGNYIFRFILKYLSHVPILSTVFGTLIYSKNVTVPVVLTIIFTGVYTFISRKNTNFIKELPGGLFSSLGWFFLSYFFSLWVDKSPSFSTMYAGLSTLIIALMWCYFCMIIIFIGAEINMFLRRHVYKKKT